MKKLILSILLSLFFFSCQKTFEPSEEESITAEASFSLGNDMTEAVLRSLSVRMLEDDFANLNMENAYIHAIPDLDYHVYEIPFRKQSKFQLICFSFG